MLPRSASRVGRAEVVDAARGARAGCLVVAAAVRRLDGVDRDQLAALPVPLADGRTAHGPAGVSCPSRGCRSSTSARWACDWPIPRRSGRPRRAAARAAGGAAGHRRGRARRPRRPHAPWRARMDAVEDDHDGPDRRTGPRGARPSSRPPGPRPASCRGWPSWRCRTPPGVGAGGGTGAARLGARRRPGGGRARRPGPGDGRGRDPEALRAVGVLDTFALVPARTPTTWRRRRRRVGRRVLDRLPPDAPPPAWPR